MSCKAVPGLYRCVDCYNGGLLCQNCVVAAHAPHPLHRVQVKLNCRLLSLSDHVHQFWNGAYFEKTTLKGLGLRIQLGHIDSSKCHNPKRASNDDFVVVDSNGVHSVALDFCHCGHSSASPEIQLLRSRWYPATGGNPKSAATFRVLEIFHILSFESKCSGFEFYNALSRLTDNSGVHPEKVGCLMLFAFWNSHIPSQQDRYDEFMRMVRQWRNLKMLKRAGRGHAADGIEGTQLGECALLCPACPHAGINLPDGWEDEPPDKRYVSDICF